MKKKLWVNLKIAASAANAISARVQVGTPSTREAVFRMAIAWATPCPISIPANRLGRFHPSWNLLLEDNASLSGTLYNAFPCIDLSAYASEKDAKRLLRRRLFGESKFQMMIRKLVASGYPNNFIAIFKNIDRAHRSIQAAIAEMLLHHELRVPGLQTLSTEGINFLCTISGEASSVCIDARLRKILVPAVVGALTPEIFSQWISWRLAALTLSSCKRERALMIAKIDPELLAKMTREIAHARRGEGGLTDFVTALEAQMGLMGPIPDFPKDALNSGTPHNLCEIEGNFSWQRSQSEYNGHFFRFPLDLTLQLFEGQTYS